MIRVTIVLLCIMLCGCSFLNIQERNNKDENMQEDNSNNEDANEIKDKETILGSNNTMSNENTNDLVNPRVVKQGENYKLLHGDNSMNAIYVYTSNGNEALSVITSRPLGVEMLGDNVIDVYIGYGTAVIKHQYYNVSKDILSDEYWDVIAASEDLIAYILVSTDNSMENRRVVIEDIFKENHYYKTVNLDFSAIPWPIVSSEFSEDGSQLDIVYWAGEEFVRKTETISIE